ncbi:hypothetical protein GGX14DRAFT_609368 [Mycena pura]|uniref:Uncharacterized protein n=1 Tax=Mycena pura TaxID=153505 RepID=A0AAD6XZ28_9AGAR|nr:hypothetical protein GGX14DRAFT_609368 [Mycena pura]
MLYSCRCKKMKRRGPGPSQAGPPSYGLAWDSEKPKPPKAGRSPGFQAEPRPEHHYFRHPSSLCSVFVTWISASLATGQLQFLSAFPPTSDTRSRRMIPFTAADPRMQFRGNWGRDAHNTASLSNVQTKNNGPTGMSVGPDAVSMRTKLHQ